MEDKRDYKKMWNDLKEFIGQGYEDMSAGMERLTAANDRSTQGLMDLAATISGIAALEVILDRMKDLEVEEEFDFIMFLEDFLREH